MGWLRARGTAAFLLRLLARGYAVYYRPSTDAKPIGGAVVLATIRRFGRRRLECTLFKNRLFLLAEFIVHHQYLDQLPALIRMQSDRHRSGDLFVVDAGANVGLFPLLLQTRLPRQSRLTVVGFEPFSENRALCEENWRRNGLSFHVRREALSDRAAPEMPLHVLSTTGATIEPSEVEAYTASRGARASIPTERVPVTTLDELLSDLPIPRVDVLKLDIEGAEESALRGATTVIRRFHPFVICSYEHGHNDKERIAGIVCGCGDYDVRDNPGTHVLTFVPRPA